MAEHSNGGALAEESLFTRSLTPGTSFLILLLIVQAYAWVNFLFAPMTYGDIDDYLRAYQIKDLLNDGQWFDRAFPKISLPAVYESPWSRLVDAPYVGLKWILGIFLPEAQAMRLSFIAIPPLLLIAFTGLIHAAVIRVLGKPLNLIILIVLATSLLIPTIEFVPSRIDHHNFQLVFLAGILFALASSPSFSSGIWVGALITLSVIVGLELLPILCLVILAVAITAMGRRSADQNRLIGMGSALSLTTLLSGLILVGPTGLSRTACDAMSAPYAIALMCAGAILCVAPFLWRRLPDNLILRFATLAVPGALLLGALAVMFPICLSGPYHMIDPVSRVFWLSKVIQEATTFTLVYRGGFFLYVLVMSLSLAAVIISAPRYLKSPNDMPSKRRIIWLIGLLGIILALWQIRFARIGLASCLLLVPAAVSHLMHAGTRPKVHTLASAGFAVILFLGIGYSPLSKPQSTELTAYDFMVGDQCDTADTAALEALPPGRAMVAFGIVFTLLNADIDHTISAIPFHRSAPGINEMARAFTAPDPDSLASALSEIDYVIVCARDEDLPLDDLPLYRDLVQRQPPAGLTLTAPAKSGSLAIYRVD